ncbi:hypothetical protein MFU01_84900 [Myxococcus fulvus]|uniref:Lipoprotein n=3 Tax=Myxococcus fulvus TaxID=33 RepID=A0A511TIM9_MYXFU|nr:hypothetical protein MFU01_84900 [Myxococcus fulvus]
MSVMGLRRLALWAGLVLMAACGGPLPEEMDSSEWASQEEMSQEELSQEDPDIESALYENAQATCPYQGGEACSWKPICAAYCCDGSRHRRYLACGDCTAFSLNVCASRGGLWRMEWHEI